LDKLIEGNVNGTVLFKQEPCLVVVSCKEKEGQWQLFSAARNNGWKKSGILSMDKKRLIELMASENISFPIFKDGKILVDDDFLKLILKKSNDNLEKCWVKIERLKALI
jgi:tRNA wybutosine-synthesizing protein 3